MKKEIKIGPIQKRPTVDQVRSTLRKQANMMKIGEFFEVTGVDRNDVNKIRAALSYYAKQGETKVSTSFSGNKLTVERIRK